MYRNMAPLMPHRWLRVLLIGLVAGVLLGQPLMARAAAPSLAPSDTVFTVNTANDANDGSCTDAHCSLREAIVAANATANGSTPDEIHFNIPGGGVRTITPNSSGQGSLPPITDPVVIDGTTQPGASCAAWPPTLLVQLSGSSLADGSNLLTITASDSIVRGLVLNGTATGAALHVTGSDNRVECNFIGTNAEGTSALPNLTGVRVEALGENNIIGTNSDGSGDEAERNLISGNTDYGVALISSGDNHLAGNTIGTNAAGTAALANGTGVYINDDSGNIIGTNGDGTRDAAEGNLISGNTSAGVLISEASNTRVAGNRIGTDATGTSAIPNNNGVVIGMSPANVVGTNGDGTSDELERNLISGNSSNGVLITGADSSNNRVAGNYIGTDADGTSALPNVMGVRVEGSASNNIIGTDSDGTADEAERNLISGNSLGVVLTGSGTSGNRVSGNTIGSNAAGTGTVANYTGVRIEGSASNNIIGTNGDGTADVSERNLISGNDFNGVNITESGTSGNRVAGNYIGTNAAGTGSLANSTGVLITFGASDNIIGTNGDGTADEAERNLISRNTRHGVRIDDSGTSGNRVAGNYIGTNAAGTSILANGIGVYMRGSASENIIGTNGDGTADEAERNLISGSTSYGVWILGTGTDNNRVAGNYIGTDATGTSALPNSIGVYIADSASDNIIGTNGDGTADVSERNLISGSSQYGVLIIDSGTSSNRVAGNYIGTEATGTSGLPNSTGVYIASGASDNIIGTNGDGMGDAAERNLISGHNATFEGTAVRITDVGTNNNRVAGNYIGTTADGTTALANSWGVRIDRSESNVIGTNGDGTGDAAEGNLISGSVIIGIYLQNSANNNRIAGNTIGTDAAGTSAIPNQRGIEVASGDSTLIGTDGDGVSDAAERNLISGNTEDGIRILTSNNRIAGNYIGTNAAGTSALANDRGITLGGADNILGTNSDGSGDEAERNLISGNTSTGVVLGDRHWVAGNYIGTNAAGTAAIPNGTGIFFSESSGPTIVGTNGDGTRDAAEGNLISGNIGGGVVLSESRNNRVAGNRIGTDATGTSAIPNNNGVVMGMSYDNIVGTNGDGTSDELERNLISGSSSNGVLITGADSSNNRVAGNTIGTNAEGTSALPNLMGVRIQSGASDNIIGTNGDGTGDAAERNLISGHNAAFEGTAVRITGAGNNNRVAGNYIGTTADGTTALANSWGVRIDGSENTIIGTNGDGVGDAAEGNLISGSAVIGIYLENSSNNNRIAGNTIGTDATGTNAIANWIGIEVYSGDSNIIGTNGDGVSDEAERNLISGNTEDGVQVRTSNNRVAGNYIGTDPTGTSAIPNYTGVRMVSPGGENIIGTNSDGSGDEAERNLISGNTDYGVLFISSGDNHVAGNTIGTNAAGTAALPNGRGVYSIDDSGNIIGTNGDGTHDATEGNLISGNSGVGVAIVESYNTRVAGNFIGTDATGTRAIPNSSGVVIALESRRNIIGTNGDGTSDELERNVISGNSGVGIRLNVDAQSNTIAGNLIGVTPSVDTPGDLDPLGNGADGLIILAGEPLSSGNLIGGDLPVEQNTIAYNGDNGVALVGGTGNRVQRNAIYDNSALGIDLGDNGPTPNDAEDPDLGPNHYQNYPTVTAVINGSGELVVTYFVDSLTTNSTYPLTIEFFEADDVASGEGQTFLAEDSYNETPATLKEVSLGNANALGIAAGDPLVATATDANGNTSEFSLATVVESDVPTALTLDTFAAARGAGRETPAFAALALAALVGLAASDRRRRAA